MLRAPWKRGPAAGAPGPYVVSATRFVYRRRRFMPLVALHGWRLRRRWGSRGGAVGLFTGFEATRPVTYSLSVWAGEQDLRRFLGSPEHVALVRGFRDRLAASRSAVWRAEGLDRDELWREGLRRVTP